MVSAKFSLLKKNKPVGEEKPAGRVDYYEFIPYHSHFNPHTLLTKDGELVQIIKIDGNLLGENCENLDGFNSTVRDAVRNAIAACDLSEKIGFWIHVIRKRKAFQNPNNEQRTTDGGFADYISEKWEKTNSFQHSYYNEIYITLMHDGLIAPLIPDKSQSKRMIFPAYNRKIRNEYMDKIQIRMDDLTDSVVESLSNHCSARRLGLYEDVPSSLRGSVSDRGNPENKDWIASASPRNDNVKIFHSELMELYGNIFNLRAEKLPLPDVNLSVALQTCTLDFGFNFLEAKSKFDGSKRYATMLSLKQYRDMPVETIDRVLQAPIEMIISQSFVAMPNAKALKHYLAQKELFEMSGDKLAQKMFGVSEMMECDHKGATDFGEQQINIMIMADDGSLLDREVSTFQQIFSELGLILVREDMRVEECFWAQFPGNFEFVRRKDTIAREKVAGFCRLNRFHEGSFTGNHWGNCVAVIPTSVGSPYGFNFHDGENGHTALFDFNSFGDKAEKILQHFLLTQTRKLGARLIIFDRNHSARLLLNKLGGGYFTLNQLLKINRDRAEDKSPRLALNPFTIEDTKYNQSFLAAWCALLISPNTSLDDVQKGVLRAAVTQVFSLPMEQRNLPNMAAIISQIDSELAEPLNHWVGKGEFAGRFDYAQDNLDASVQILGFDMTSATLRPEFLLPLFAYLMHRVIGSINEQPTIIVLNEAWDLLENSFFAPRLESLLEMLSERNVMVLFTTSKSASIKEYSTLPTIMSSCATKIYVPDEMPLAYNEPELELTPQDALMLLDMHRPSGDFLVKQRGESIALTVSLKDSEDAIAIFSNDIKSLGAAHGRFAAIPQDY